ncbi:MAG: hypothetical protein CSB34_06055 [Desulfobulbus propionicus]|nr:MAG: hypothetical protein CSB34_06055 [Desulfobulbus propionicus]
MKFSFDFSQLTNTPFDETDFFFVCFDKQKKMKSYKIEGVDSFECYLSPEILILTSHIESDEKDKIFSDENNVGLFIGYELDQTIHSYTSCEKKKNLFYDEKLINGVFTYIHFDKQRKSISIKTDPFGISPVYFRELNNLILFSSHPSLISIFSDEPDFYSWLSLIMNGFICGNRSFFRDIRRLETGMKVNVSEDTLQLSRWFDLRSLPEGNQSIDANAFQLVEKACQQSIDKCLLLEHDNVILPYSSGYDSRRFLASFLDRGISFTTLTCQSYHEKDGQFFDIDAVFAPPHAKKMGAENTILSAYLGGQLKNSLTHRRHLIGSESFMHGWAMPMMEYLRAQPPSLIFDGLAGDAIGNGGWEYDGLHDDATNDKEIVLAQLVDKRVFSNLSFIFPSHDDFREEIARELLTYPNNLNGIELAFLLLRTRRAISPMATMMTPKGHVLVYPYLDLNFVKTCLAYSPKEKLSCFFQKICLQKFWPSYYHSYGTRNLPEGYEPLKKSKVKKRCREVKKERLNNYRAIIGVLKYLNFKNKVLFLFLWPLFGHRDWLYGKLLELEKFNLEKIIVLKKE